jgi:hypothetical protein
VVELEQTLDRMLADAASSPAGTSGTAGTPATVASTGGGTIVVERARLVQLRQQLDAILAAIDRR